MALKYRFSTKAEIPAELVSHYAERDGAFVLEVEGGFVPKATVDEFRDNNIALKKQVADLNKQYEGLDPAAISLAVEAKRKLDEGELLKKGDIEGVVLTRIAPMEKRATAAEAQLAELLVNQGAIAAGRKRGLRVTADQDLVLRARGAFKVVNGKAVPVCADGVTPKMGKDGVTLLTFDEWAEVVATEAPHLFESNSGSGAGGSGPGGAGNVKNPWAKASWNLTQQMQITKSDPKRADALQAAAGV